MLLLPTDSNKLLLNWKGPFEIIEKVGSLDYMVKIGEDRIKIFHANLLKKYESRTGNSDLANVEIDINETISVSVINSIDTYSNDVPIETCKSQGQEDVAMVNVNKDLLTNKMAEFGI